MIDNPKLERILADAKRNQMRLAKQVIVEDDPPISNALVTGVDVAYSDDIAVGCAVTIDSGTMKTIESINIVADVSFPYISGFFHLREGPIILGLLKKVQHKGPILIDGHGVFHPRRCGLASYIGVIADVQTIGVAKRPILPTQQCETDYGKALTIDGEVVGALLHIEGRRHPFYVSIGHRISLETAVRVVKGAILNGQVEPLRLAHVEANRVLHESLSC